MLMSTAWLGFSEVSADRRCTWWRL